MESGLCLYGLSNKQKILLQKAGKKKSYVTREESPILSQNYSLRWKKTEFLQVLVLQVQSFLYFSCFSTHVPPFGDSFLYSCAMQDSNSIFHFNTVCIHIFILTANIYIYILYTWKHSKKLKRLLYLHFDEKSICWYQKKNKKTKNMVSRTYIITQG